MSRRLAKETWDGVASGPARGSPVSNTARTGRWAGENRDFNDMKPINPWVK